MPHNAFSKVDIKYFLIHSHVSAYCGQNQYISTQSNTVWFIWATNYHHRKSIIQCDKMACLFVLYLSICNSKNFPNIKRNSHNRSQNKYSYFCQSDIKFRQIYRSHLPSLNQRDGRHRLTCFFRLFIELTRSDWTNLETERNGSLLRICE